MIIVLLLLLPLFASLLLFSDKLGRRSRMFAFVTSLIVLVISFVGAYFYVSTGQKALVLDIHALHLLDLNISMKMDGISLILVLLTTILVPIIIASPERSDKKVSSFYALVMLMETALLGVFLASDIILFYIFWELALIPIFFITAFWGGENARKISIKFLIYTVVGSFAMLVAILYLYTLTPVPHSFDFNTFLHLSLPYEIQVPVFLAFFLAFAIKIPLFPFHSWQAETYNVSPVQGSMLLAGIMLKMGLYGLIRFILPLCPDVVAGGSLFFLPLIVFGVIYGAFIAISQPRLKKLIAFASLSHVGIIALGILSNNQYGLQGSIIQMFTHGINVVGFFLCYLVIRRRTHTDIIANLGGIASVAPKFATVFLIIVLANVSLPLTNSFVGEFMILLGLFQFNPLLAIITGTTIILGAVYMLKMYQKIMYGPTNELTSQFKDLTTKEMILFTPIIVLIFLIGIYPTIILQFLDQVKL